MAKLLKAHKTFEDNGTPNGLDVTYRVGGDVRSLWLSAEDIDGLTSAQIKVLAQSRADADNGADGSGVNLREDVLADPIREARQFFRDNAALRSFLSQDIAGIESDIDGASLAQVKEVVKALSVVCRAYGLLEIAD